MLFFTIYFGLSIAVLIMKRLYFDYLNTEANCTDATANYTIISERCKCAYLEATDPNRFIRLIIEIILLIYSILYLVKFCYELYIQKLHLYTQTLLFNPSKIIFILSLISYLLIVPLRFTCNHVGEDYLVVISIIFKSGYILYLGRGFRVITTFVYIIHRVIKTNFFRFVIIFIVFVLGFSQAFYVIYEFGKSSKIGLYDSPLEAIFDLFTMSLRDLGSAYVNLLSSDYNVIGRFFFVLLSTVITLLLFNLLVAMMTHTYNLTTELKREWLRQWAKQVLTIEQNVSGKERLKQQKKYANTLNSGEKAFIVRWKMTDVERENMKSFKSFFQSKIMDTENFNTIKDID